MFVLAIEDLGEETAVLIVVGGHDDDDAFGQVKLGFCVQEDLKLNETQGLNDRMLVVADIGISSTTCQAHISVAGSVTCPKYRLAMREAQLRVVLVVMVMLFDTEDDHSALQVVWVKVGIFVMSILVC